MSLINDALKRAKAAQKDVPAQIAAGLQLRPVEPENPVRRGVGVAIPFTLAAVALLVLLFVWQYAPRKTAREGTQPGTSVSQPRARTLPETKPAAVAPQAPADIAAPKTVSPAGNPATQSATTLKTTAVPTAPGAGQAAAAAPGSGIAVTGAEPAAMAVTAQPDASPAKSQPTVAAVQASSVTNVQPPPPKPAVPRLQGIVFDPRRPSAVINGKTLFIGDRVAGFRLVALRADSATLVGNGQTNVLVLDQ